MSPVKLTVVSDSHLSPRTPEASANWEALVAHVESTEPDAVIHTGDIARDGPAGEHELRFAKTELDKLPGPIHALPGNHDLGDNPCETNADSDHLITADLLAAYRHHFGADHWALDLGPWRLIGANAQLFDSGLDDEEEQWEWLATELAASDEGPPRHRAVFLHKPLFHSDPHPPEHDLPIRYVRQSSRQRLLRMLEAASVQVVVSGHVHQHRRMRARGMDHIWAPTSWATLSESMQATIGERWVGALDLTLADDGTVEIDHVRPPGVGQYVIGETIPNPYLTVDPADDR